MSAALPLPPRPSLEHYRKRAKELVKLLSAGDADALRSWVREWVEAIYRLDTATPGGSESPQRAQVAHAIDRVFKRLSEKRSHSPCTLADAQLAIAREHGFASWPKFSRHIQELTRAQSPISAFEAAVDAVITGNVTRLEELLRENPRLVRARSTRAHRSTLLHYVSANGVEDYRQKTPKNAVAIAKTLLTAGADVNAESEAYGGRSTTLGLTATSYHPEAAGVQLPLMELLIEHGATLDGPDGQSIVNACLRNGRGLAAEFLADRGARLDLEGAAGVGRLDLVKAFFDDDGRLKPSATLEQMKDALAWACEYGRPEVVVFLVDADRKSGTKLLRGRHTGLHWAAFNAHADIVRLLLEQGTPVDVKDDRHNGTPLEWALYGWQNSAERAEPERYYEVVALLARAGATPDPQWFDSVENRQGAANRLKADARMLAALRGETGRA